MRGDGGGHRPDPRGLAEPRPRRPERGPAAARRHLRVDVDRIDALVRLTGELLIAKNAIGHSAGLAQDAGDPRQLAAVLKNQHLLLDRLVGELQRAVLSLRVLPLTCLPALPAPRPRDGRRPRQAGAPDDRGRHDGGRQDDRRGDSEPLLHVLRNGVDHGLEDAAERAAARQARDGDHPAAAARQGEHVIIEVEDDGGGIDLARVREVARERNVGAAGRARRPCPTTRSST